MKKLFILASILCFSIAVQTVQAAEPTQAEIQKFQAAQTQIKLHRERIFEKRLGLTEVQKLKAREIRQKGHDTLNPVLDQIKNKKQEAEMIRRSRMAVQMQEEKLTVIDNELKVLEKQAQNIRKQNMKEFESILTWQQKRILKEMKKEGRKNFREHNNFHKHPKKPQPFHQVK